MTAIHFEPLDPAHLDALLRVVSLSYGTSTEAARGWLVGQATLPEVRAAGRAGGSFDPARTPRVPEASLVRIPMGLFLGGRAVRNLGIAGVAVTPEARGGGLARAMVAAALREARAEGFAVSTLYASTLSLYRKVGFEPAGHAFRYAIPLQLDRPLPGPRTLAAAALPSEITPELVACHRRFAALHDGALDRGHYIWRRVLEWRDRRYDGFGLRSASGELEAYVFLALAPTAQAFISELVVRDLAWTTPRGARELLAFLHDYAPVARTLHLHGGPCHPLCTLLPQQAFSVERHEYWLLRILDVPAALESRGYRPGLSLRFSLEVADDVLPEVAGAYTVALAGGAARVTRGASAPVVRLDVRTLASLYTGFSTAESAASLGLCEGPPEALSALSAAFAGPPPSMSDHF